MLKIMLMKYNVRKNDNKHFGEWTLSSDYFSLRSFSLWFVHSLKRRQEMLKIMLMKYNVRNKFQFILLIANYNLKEKSKDGNRKK